MRLQVLSTEAALNLFENLRGKPLPAPIQELKEEIKKAEKSAMLGADATGKVDEFEVRRIVNMKLELVRLFALWAEGRLVHTAPNIIIAH